MVLELCVVDVERIVFVEANVGVPQAFCDLLTVERFAPVTIGGVALIMERAVGEDDQDGFLSLGKFLCQGHPVLKGAITIHAQVAHTVTWHQFLELGRIRFRVIHAVPMREAAAENPDFGKAVGHGVRAANPPTGGVMRDGKGNFAVDRKVEFSRFPSITQDGIGLVKAACGLDGDGLDGFHPWTETHEACC